MANRLFFFSFLFLLIANRSHASIESHTFIAADRKNEFYIRDGIVNGGDRSVNRTVIRSIRRSISGRSERIVFDLHSTPNNPSDENLNPKKPPYFHAAIDAARNRLSVSLWSQVQELIDVKSLQKAFEKSASVSQVLLIPKSGDDPWSIVFELNKNCQMEAFELHSPARIVIDLQKIQ